MKDEGSNLGTMIIIQKLGLEKSFSVVVLATHFLKHANMQQQMRKSTKASNMYLYTSA
jgi:hypothetical protein